MTGCEGQALRFIREALGLEDETPVRVTAIECGGSDRTFSRCATECGTFVLMLYGLAREENALYVPIAHFLKETGIRVPAILAHNPVRRLVLMEDLGERDLWSFRNDPWNVRESLYGQALAMAARLHAFPLDTFPHDDVRLMPAFDSRLYRWERDYFREQFVAAACGVALEPAFAAALEEELSSLADRIMTIPACLIHRDLQSRNIVIMRGEPAWIDFQGMRPGSPFYDVASLLYDPYVSFTEEERLILLRLYAGQMSHGMKVPDILAPFREAAVQRLMQALGAYGFLGLRMGKRSFLSHIPRGIDHLEDAASRIADLPNLKELIGMCRRALPAALSS